MIDFFSLFEYCELKAINACLDPTPDSVWRIRCRQYSVQFHTALHVVMNELDPMMVLQALYEDKYHPSIIEQEGEDLLEKLYLIKDPTYRRVSKEEEEQMVDAVLNREIARAAKKKRPTQETIQAEIKKAESKPLPKSGGMDFGNLEEIDGKAEANKEGF
jgi:hypothetical protein